MSKSCFSFFCTVLEHGSHNPARIDTPTTLPTPTAMSSHAVRGAETRARKRNRERGTNPQEALPGLPQDVVVTHILRSDTDPIVLARLKAVSRAMRDAVERTGLRVVERTSGLAAGTGCLDTIQHKLKKGRLDKSEVCKFAARGGQLEVLQWAQRLPVGREYVLGGGKRPASRSTAVGARERLPVGRADVLGGGGVRVSRGAAVVAREPMPVGRGYVLVGGKRRTS